MTNRTIPEMHDPCNSSFNHQLQRTQSLLQLAGNAIDLCRWERPQFGDSQSWLPQSCLRLTRNVALSSFPSSISQQISIGSRPSRRNVPCGELARSKDGSPFKLMFLPSRSSFMIWTRIRPQFNITMCNDSAYVQRRSKSLAFNVPLVINLLLSYSSFVSDGLL